MRSRPNQALRLSPAGLVFIARWEGYRRYPYNDPWNATIGYGHLLHLGPVRARDKLRYPLGLREPAARRLLRKDAASAEAAVRADVDAVLNQFQYDALVSFTFNCGVGALNHSKALRLLNEGHYLQAADALLDWDHGNGGVVVAGLLRRRNAERVLFVNERYDSS